MLLVETVGVLKMHPHVGAERLVTLRHLIEQVTDRNDLAKLQGVRCSTMSMAITFRAVRSRWRTDDTATKVSTSAGLKG